MQLADRRERHRRISDFLASRSDLDLIALSDPAEAGVTAGRAGSVTFEVDGVPVFTKRVPLTDLELAHPRSTANLFDLPTRCQFFFGVPHVGQYGFGGPTLNAWRELAANLAVTEGVLAGETEAFSLLYHWRVLPIPTHLAAEQADVDAVVAALDGSTTVRARLDAVRNASHSLLLFSEYIPYPLADWLQDDPTGRAETFERQLFESVVSLRNLELIHMDGGWDNMRTNGHRVYFVDFGLTTSPRFDLSSAEHAVARRLATHDADYAALRLTQWVATSICGMPVPARGEIGARDEFISRCAAGNIPDGLPPAAARILARHAPAAVRIFDFYRRLFDGELRLESLCVQAPTDGASPRMTTFTAGI